ncbi:MAG: [protein-PII] uridylyltransferase, partial [Acidimicrobiales bacterium]
MATAPPVESLRDRRERLIHEADLQGEEFARRYAAEADQWLRALFSLASGAEDSGLVLIAVGGYGRGELAPGSDLDLLLVHDRRSPVAPIADALWYPIWDQGVRLDHSVRRPREVREAMEGDLRVALGLLEMRTIAGDARLGVKVEAGVRDLWGARSSRWLPQVGAATAERHRQYGDLAFLLEPDLKEARGGLRDANLLRALAPVAPAMAGLIAEPSLVGSGVLLGSVRVELQRATGRLANRLTLQDQDLVADVLSDGDADDLMAKVATAGRNVAWASDEAWRRVRSSLAGPRGRGGSKDRPLEPGLVLRDGEVTIAVGADAASDPSLALRAAAVSAEADLPLATGTLDHLARRAGAPEGTWPPECLRALIRLLGAGRPAIAATETLDHQGVLLKLLPEWEAVRNRPQRNAYHRFTVDRHLLETAANASTMVRDVDRPDLLLLGALLHDIGKGRGVDHTVAGMALVAELGPRLGLPAADTAVLVKLVELHLLLPDAATRRDLDDPATAEAVAAAVGDVQTLQLLAALTEADSLATGSSAWGPWKADLVSVLVRLTSRLLEGHPPPAGPPEPTPKQVALLRSGGLSVSGEGTSVTVVAPDRPDLLAAVAVVLAL